MCVWILPKWWGIHLKAPFNPERKFQGLRRPKINTELGLLAITSCGLFPNTIGLVGKVRTTAIATFATRSTHWRLQYICEIQTRSHCEKTNPVSSDTSIASPISWNDPGGPSHTKTKPTNQNHHEIVRACKSGSSIGQLYPISAVGITAIAVSSHPQLPKVEGLAAWFFPMIHGTNPVAFLSHKAVAEGRSIEIQNMHLP